MIMYSISCVGGCKSFFEADDPAKLERMAEQAGWSLLQITGRYHCGTCERELFRASTVEGASPRLDVDKLPPASIGALKKLPEPQVTHEKVKP